MKILILGAVLVGIIGVVSGESGCLCGGLGEGTDGCRQSGDHGVGHGIGIKGQKLRRPSYQAPVGLIKAAHRQMELEKAIQRTKSVTVGGKIVGGCGGSQAYERKNEEFPKSAVDELLRLGSNAAIAPRFSAIGRDACFGGAKGSSYSLDGSRQPSNVVVVPAQPGLPTCLTCGGSTSNEVQTKSRYGFHSRGRLSSKTYGTRSSSASENDRECGCGGSGTNGRDSYSQGSKAGDPRGRKGMGEENEGSTEQRLIGFGSPGSVSRAGSFAFGSAGSVSSSDSFGFGAPGSGGSPGAFGLGRSLSGYTGNGMFGAANGNSGPAAPSRFLSALGVNQAASPSAGINEFDVDREGPTLSFEEQEKIYNKQNTAPMVPADPVSVALAYKKLLEPLQSLARGEGLVQGKRKFDAESSLAFGPMSVPKDGRVKHIESDIPEEKMSTVDKPIVELKHQAIAAARAVGGSSCDESDAALAQQEAIEREREALENAESDCNYNSPALVSMSTLGYGPVTPNRNTFVARSSVNSMSRSNVVTGGSSGVFGGPGGSGGFGSPSGFGSSDVFGGPVSSDVGMIGNGRTSFSSGGMISGDDESPCGPIGAPRPDYRPGAVHFEQSGPNGPQYAGVNSRVSEAEAEAEADVEETPASVDSEEDDNVPTNCGSSIAEGRSYGGGELRGRLSKMWTTIPARATDNCRHF